MMTEINQDERTDSSNSNKRFTACTSGIWERTTENRVVPRPGHVPPCHTIGLLKCQVPSDVEDKKNLK